MFVKEYQSWNSNHISLNGNMIKKSKKSPKKMIRKKGANNNWKSY